MNSQPLSAPTSELSNQWPRGIAAVFFLYIVSLATSMSGMEIFSSALILCLGIHYFRQKQLSWELPPFWQPLAAFILIEAVGVLHGDATWKEKIYDLSRMRFFFVYAFVYLFLKEFSAGNRWLKPLCWVIAVIGVYGVVQHFIAIDLVRPAGKKVLMYAVPKEKVGPLVVGTFNHHLTFANVYLFYAVILTSLGIYFGKSKPWILLLGLWAYLLCFWTDSRAAWIAIPITLLSLCAAYSWKKFFVALGALVIALTLFFRFDPGAHERLERTFVHKDDLYQLGPRERLWKAQFEMIREHPWIGVGFNNNERKAKEVVDRLYPNQANFYGHAHSTPLQILATMGILGFAAYLWLWVQIFARAFEALKFYPKDRVEHWLALGLMLSFIGFHIQGITQWNFGDAEVIHNLMFFWALLAAIPLPAHGFEKKVVPNFVAPPQPA